MDTEQLVSKVRRAIINRLGTNGIRSLALHYHSTMGCEVGSQLTGDEFFEGLKKSGILLTPQEQVRLLEAFDRNGDGGISVDEFMRAIRGCMNPARAAVVDEAFAALDVNGSGAADLADVQGRYDPSRHPQVLQGNKTMQQVLQEFLAMFDSQTNPDGVVTREEFHDYYTGLSATIDADAMFDAMVRNAWVLDGASNTSARRADANPIVGRPVVNKYQTAAKRCTDTGKVYSQQYGDVTNPLVYLDVAIDTAPPQRIVIELFADILPKTCENFRALCTGERGIGLQNQPLCYQGLRVHRIVPGFCVQAGDVVFNNGKGGESIYGKTFDDESFAVSLSKPGLVAMANQGPNTNQSQFFILLKEAQYLDGRHVAFGRVVENFEWVKEMEKYGSDQGAPLKEIVIVDCGQLC
uniref:peptidylprolyl isomerase n=1 Tax=Eutreptiella gymnastica TaxID=73025 RepID=A0A7S1N9A2_9EUGL|mmetsp:Transcript_142192/g.247884  ORF Transcript_142192/g.247884 Transcript_142192/m.247884 type:complete len:409 (+) Transcript_142192:83-1309(+)